MGPGTWLTVICPFAGQNKGPGQPSEPAVLGAVRANRPPCGPSIRAVGIKFPRLLFLKSTWHLDLHTF